MFQNNVTVGPRFFAKAFNDYRNKHWAFAREIMQNSIDCGSTRIDVSINEIDGNTVVRVENNGEVMSDEILVNKLLSLGESGKDFQGSVGGFGKAKEILYFAHRGYKIETGHRVVEGSGAGYNLDLREEVLNGTRSTVTWDGSHATQLASHFRYFVKLSNLRHITFTVNGEVVKPEHTDGILNRTLDHDGKAWAEVRLSKTGQNLLIVRVGGTPMFTEYCEFKGTVIVELLGSSAERLTSNRDGVRYPYSSDLSAFITSIAVDKRTVFKLEKAEYCRYSGKRLARKRKPVKVEPETPPIYVAPAPATVAVAAHTATVPSAPPTGGGILTTTEARKESPACPLGFEFVVKNTVKRAVPEEYLPESFNAYSAWVAKAWAGCLLELHELYEIDHNFAVGFVFSEDDIAQSERTDEYGQVYYLNPCKVTRKSSTRRFTKADRWDILAIAIHEFIHGALGVSYHNQEFANKQTEVTGRALKVAHKFARRFRNEEEE